MRAWRKSWRILGWLIAGTAVGCATAPETSDLLDQSGYWQPGSAGAAERFELAKRSTPELISYIRRMPKGADLHNHLSGASYADFMMQSARDAGHLYDRAANRFVDMTSETTVSFDDFISNAQLVSAFRNSVSIRGWLGEGGNGHDAFFKSFQHMAGTGRRIPEMLAEVLARNHYQNVQHVELMVSVAPVSVIGRFVDRFRGLDLDDLPQSLDSYRPLFDDPDVNREFTQELDRWQREAESILRSEYGLRWADMPSVSYIPQLDRSGPIDRFFGAAVLFMVGVQADPRIVGLNIVAPEDLPLSHWQFDDQMKIIDYLWRELDRPAITLHAGELSLRESPVEPMQDRIRRSITQGHARRIGHGVSIAWEKDLFGLLAKMKREGILVELIPSSAEVILGKAGPDHPFYLYRSAGVPMCICTDDEGVSRTNLTMEYVKMVQNYGLSYVELIRMSRACLEHAFLDDDTRSAMLSSFDAAVADFERVLSDGFRERYR